MESNPELKEELIPGSECLKVEAAHARDHEMVVHLEDFLRRRTKISMMISQKNLEENPATKEACQILFGDHSVDRWTSFIESCTGSKRCCAELTSKNVKKLNTAQRDQQLYASRIAWYYYKAGWTQNEIAEKLGLNRARVISVLNEARASGRVTIHVHGADARLSDLEHQLCEKWHLKRSSPGSRNLS